MLSGELVYQTYLLEVLKLLPKNGDCNTGV